MENKNVGYLLIGIAAVIVMIILLFNSVMKDVIVSSCSMEHSETCSMYSAVNQQTYLSLGIVGIIMLIGVILIFTKPEERIIIKKVKEKKIKRKIDTSGFRLEDKKVLRIIQENKTIFQADLIDSTSFGKAKMSRIIDRLEGKGLVERKRRGMTNVVVLKN